MAAFGGRETARHRRGSERGGGGIVVLGAVAVAAGAGIYAATRQTTTIPPTTTPPGGSGNPPSASDLALVQQALASEGTQGWDAAANSGMGGVKVNWYLSRTGSQNLGHDQGEDLRYLEALTLYKAAQPADTSLDADLAKIQPVVSSLFKTHGYDKSWAWVSLINLGWWDGAYSICKFWLSKIDPAVGIAHGPIITSTAAGAPTIPDGYRVDAALQKACGMIVVGHHFNDTAMVAAGQRGLVTCKTQAFSSHYGMYARIVENPASHPVIYDYQAKAGEQGQNAWALAIAGQTAAATALIDGMKSSGLHDTANGGFFFVLHLDSGSVNTSYKEQGRCMTITRAAQLLGDTALQAEMLQTARKSFQKGADAAGWVYQTTPTWGIYKNEDWVTSESIALNSLAILTAS